MPTDRERRVTHIARFAQTAREKGLLDRAQIDELRAAAQEPDTDVKNAADGFAALLEKAVTGGLLTRTQVHDVLREWLPDEAPRTLGRYEIVEEIGKGGMGSVYKAWDPRLQVYVAIKTLFPQYAATEGFIRRFEREARLGARLQTPHAIRVFDVGEEGTNHYIVMDYVEGESASEILFRQGSLEERHACAICADVARALAEAKEHNIIHRDIKPANIMIDRRGVVKLADLGVAKQLVAPEDDEASKHLSQTVGVVGTPSYMSPEQAMGRELDFRSDIYALGAALYHLVCGKRPYDGATAQEIMFGVAHDPQPDPRELSPDLSDAAASVIGKMMAKDPNSRYQDHVLVIADLERCAEGRGPIEVPTPEDTPLEREPMTEQITAQAATPPPRRSGAVWVGIAAVLALFAAAVLGQAQGWWAKLGSGTARTRPARPPVKQRPRAQPVTAVVAPPAEPEVRISDEQRKAAAAAGVASGVEADLGGGVMLRMVHIPAGRFTMGSSPKEAGRGSDEGPPHEVTFSRGFYMAIHEVTQAQWQAVMGTRPARFRGDRRPVESVSWDNCQTFVSRLNAREQGRFRLPTEAEWEYACRAAATGAYYFARDVDVVPLSRYANTADGKSTFAWLDRRARDGYDNSAPVGRYLPNAWGLYDMLGNVAEWCEDWYASDYYAASPATDPKGPAWGGSRVVRGGSWADGPLGCRVAARSGTAPNQRNPRTGFRVVWEPQR